MIVINLTAGTTANSTPLTFTVNMNTNDDFIVNDTSIEITKAGIYEFIGSVSISSTASGTATIGTYQGTTALSNLASVSATEADEVANVCLYDVQKIIVANSSYVTIQLLTTNAPTIVNGEISIKRIV